MAPPSPFRERQHHLRVWSLGSDDEANAEKTVALKFVLPKEPYASAPFYANAAKPVNLKKYTKIIVEEGDWTIGTDKTKTFYPLAYLGFGQFIILK